MRGATVTVDVPVAPKTCVSVVGFAETVKSCTWTVTVAVLVKPLAVPVTVQV